jgi:putative peptide zinc metalloprotease protein
MLQRRRLSALVTIVAAVALAAPPPAGAEGRDNHVTAVNYADEWVATQARAVIAQDRGPQVAAENTALARASCTDCRTVAVAAQVVAVVGAISEFRPFNAALALNEECLRCQTYAYARQEIIAVDGEFSLSDAGRDEVRRLEYEIERVADSAEPFLEMGAELDRLVVQLREVVRGELEKAGRRESGRWARRDVDARA